MSLREDLAVNAIETHIAGPCGVAVHEAAVGILRVAVTNMVGAVRNITMQQGHDPRDFVLVAYGGAGPVHGRVRRGRTAHPEGVDLARFGAAVGEGTAADPVQSGCSTHLCEGPGRGRSRRTDAGCSRRWRSRLSRSSPQASPGNQAIRVRRILKLATRVSRAPFPSMWRRFR